MSSRVISEIKSCAPAEHAGRQLWPSGRSRLLLFAWLLTACGLPPAAHFLDPTAPMPIVKEAAPSLQPAAIEPTPRSASPSADEPTVEPRKPAGVESPDWKDAPVIPQIGERARAILAAGISADRDPQAFSKVGDGGVWSSWFLSVFDGSPAGYELGPYQELAAVIEHYAGSFGRVGLAARAGFNTSRILDPQFAPNDVCEVDESPLECELRVHRPSVAIISLGTNQVWAVEVFAAELRQIVEVCLAHGALPILATKGDNLEGDYRINQVIADLAAEYQIPLWNFWRAIQMLPDRGLQADGEHLTWAPNHFGDDEAMSHAWPVRNLTALQVLERLIQK